jgi:hypothetical protein
VGAADGAASLALARARHADERRPFAASNEAAISRMAAGEAMARAWIAHRAAVPRASSS